MTDEEILRNYFNTVYNSELYKRLESCGRVEEIMRSSVTSDFKWIKFTSLTLLSSIFYAAYRFFYDFEEPSIVNLIIILLALIFFIISKRNYKKDTDSRVRLTNEYYDLSKEYEDFKKNIDVPPIPSIMDNPQGIQELLAVFESKRADTFKECLIIYEQDCQHRELVRRQNALISAANAARQEAEAAKKASEQAKRDADYARRDADYHYWNNH